MNRYGALDSDEVAMTMSGASLPLYSCVRRWVEQRCTIIRQS